MTNSICGIDCGQCSVKDNCAGCEAISRDGCVIAACCRNKGYEACHKCDGACRLKERLIAEFNALGIDDMAEITDLNALSGSYINLEYALPSGQAVRLLNDKKVYLGNQVHKENSNRCYGLAADENFLLVCEYGENGCDAEIVLYKKRGAGLD